MEKKKVWSKPKLIVLARSNPEETVLRACKGDGTNQPRVNPKSGQKCYSVGSTCPYNFRT